MRLALNLRDVPDGEIREIAAHIVMRMTGNADFPDTAELVKELALLHDRYLKTMAVAASRSKQDIARKNNCKQEVITKIKELGVYVDKAVKGKDNEEVLLYSSGFPLAKVGGDTELIKPKNFSISPGKQFGEMIMQIKRVPGARSYLYEYTADPVTRESVWQGIGDTRCKKVLNNLPLGVKCWFRVAVIGSRGQLIRTEALWRYVS